MDCLRFCSSFSTMFCHVFLCLISLYPSSLHRCRSLVKFCTQNSILSSGYWISNCDSEFYVIHQSLVLCFQLDLTKWRHKQDVRERAGGKGSQGIYCPIPYGSGSFLKYILLIMLLQLPQFFPLFPFLPSTLFPFSNPSPLSSCPWVVHVSSLASPFPILFLLSPCLFCTYQLCILFPVPYLPFFPFPLLADNPPNDLRTCGSVPVLVVCLVFVFVFFPVQLLIVVNLSPFLMYIVLIFFFS